MTPLRQQMIDAMQVRGLAVRTQQAYVDALARMARHFGCSPAQLDAAQIEAYMLHLSRERGRSFSTINHVASASRFLFRHVLKREDRGLWMQRSSLAFCLKSLFCPPLQPLPQRRIDARLPPRPLCTKGVQDVAIEADGGGLLVAAGWAASATAVRCFDAGLHFLTAEGRSSSSTPSQTQGGPA